MNRIRNYGMIVAGSFLLAFSVYAFTVPFDITVGGVTGISVIVNKLAGIDMSITVWAVNMLCLAFGYAFVGKELVIGSLLSSFAYPAAMVVCRMIPGIETLGSDIVLSSIMSGVLAGIGIGLVLRAGGSSGGVDILCILLNKKTGISVSVIMYAIDTVIMLGQLPFCDTSRVLYGIIAAYLMAFMIDKMLTMGVGKYQVTIVTGKYDELCHRLLQNDFGVTLQFIETGLEKVRQKAVVTTIFSKELRKVQDITGVIDPLAFVTVQKVTDVRGRGFTMGKENRRVRDHL